MSEEISERSIKNSLFATIAYIIVVVVFPIALIGTPDGAHIFLYAPAIYLIILARWDFANGFTSVIDTENTSNLITGYGAIDYGIPIDWQGMVLFTILDIVAVIAVIWGIFAVIVQIEYMDKADELGTLLRAVIMMVPVFLWLLILLLLCFINLAGIYIIARLGLYLALATSGLMAFVFIYDRRKQIMEEI